MLAYHWTQSAPDGKVPTDFKGNRVMPMLRALENVKMKKHNNLGHYYQGLFCICWVTKIGRSSILNYSFLQKYFGDLFAGNNRKTIIGYHKD